VYVSRLATGKRLSHMWDEGRGGYVYVISGTGYFNGELVNTGDAAKTQGRHELTVEATGDMELINVGVPLRFMPVGVWAR
jgi:Quercetinase C-terminal cupin domain